MFHEVGAYMSRQKKPRKIQGPPTVTGFKPIGEKADPKDEVRLLMEEYEAIRLCDYEDLFQEEAAEKMGVSRPTLTRIYDRARKKVAKAFSEGKSIAFKD